MNSAIMQKKFLSYLRRKSFDFATENIYLFEKESDVLAIKNEEIHEYEFKIGEADFRKDIKKKRHIVGKPNFFYYVVIDESIIQSEHITYAGIYVHKSSKDGFSYFRLIKKPTRIREQGVSHSELYTILRKKFNG